MLTGYKKTYFDAMGYKEGCFIPCEICQNKAVDIHHIECRGMGGTTDPNKNSIFNLMALCRDCHTTYGDIVKYMHLLKMVHLKTLLVKAKVAMNLDVELEENNGLLLIKDLVALSDSTLTTSS